MGFWVCSKLNRFKLVHELRDIVELGSARNELKDDSPGGWRLAMAPWWRTRSDMTRWSRAQLVPFVLQQTRIEAAKVAARWGGAEGGTARQRGGRKTTQTRLSCSAWRCCFEQKGAVRREFCPSARRLCTELHPELLAGLKGRRKGQKQWRSRGERGVSGEMRENVRKEKKEKKKIIK